MSSIIDALKKSDKNRTTETGANVNQIKFSNEPPEKSRRGFWLLVIILLLVAGAVFAWQRGWHHAVIAKAHQWLGEQESSEPVENKTNQAQTEAAKPNKQPTANTAKPNTALQNTNRANKLTPPKADEVKAKSNDKKTTKTTTVVAENPAKADTPKEQTEENKQDTIKLISDNKKEEIKKLLEEDRKALEPNLKQDYLLIHQINFEIRKNIPPVKLNIHIFDPEPENRMVIMNGVKFVTGDVIEELVTVKEIVKEGVVLEFENIRFLVPK